MSLVTAWQRRRISTARSVQTAHWPSRPPEKCSGRPLPRRERREQVGHDRIVVARVERHVLAPALGQGGRDVERAVAIERRDLDRDHAFDVEEAAPERPVQDASADGGLQVEPDDRDDVRDAAAVIEHVAIVGVAKRRKTQQRRIVAERDRDLRLAHGLRRLPDHARDHDRRGLRPCGAPVAHRPLREAEHGLEQADRRDPGWRTASCARRRRCRRRRRRSSSG